jgi:hypothetical protein
MVVVKCFGILIEAYRGGMGSPLSHVIADIARHLGYVGASCEAGKLVIG